MPLTGIMEVAKYVGIGGGGVGILLIVWLYWIQAKAKSNAEEIESIKNNCRVQESLTQKQETNIATLQTNVCNLTKGQERIESKIDTLISYQLNKKE